MLSRVIIVRSRFEFPEAVTDTLDASFQRDRII